LRSSDFAWLSFCLILVFPAFASAQFPAAPGTGPGLAETIEAIDSARVTTRILYITAHPDDESAAVLTYLARGVHADVALLSLTRGEGGQNALGPEQAPQLGLIRTQELLAATRGYGVKLYFTRARDFGFSKTPEETEKIWGDLVVEDMVRIIREFRPNIVINHWGGVHSGHGHHQAAGILTPKAVALAADVSYVLKPECTGCAERSPWGSASNPVVILDLQRGSENPSGYVLPLDEVSPLWGKTWRELGLDAFVNHHTQGIAGFLNSPFIRRNIALQREDGGEFDPDSLHRGVLEIAGPHGCEKESKLCESFKYADSMILQARKTAQMLDWPATVHNLDQALRAIGAVPRADIMTVEDSGLQSVNDPAVSRIVEAIQLAAGLEVKAEAERAETVLGEPLKITLTARCRETVSCTFEGPAILLPGADRLGDIGTDIRKGVNYSLTLEQSHLRHSAVSNPVPEIDSAAKICLRVSYEGDPDSTSLACAPVVSMVSSSTSTNRVPLRIVPAYTIAVDPRQTVEVLNAAHQPFDIFLRVHSYSNKAARVSVGLDVPDGLTARAPVSVDFTGIGDQYAKITVTPPAKIEAGNLTITAYAKRGDEKYSSSLEPLPSMPTLVWSEPARCIVHAFDINVPSGLRVGYIFAEGEPIPGALQRLGISIEALDPPALAFGNLSKFDAIVVGVRAYELRPELAEANKRLLDYVRNGGTLVVQYNRDNVWDKLQPAPYPAKIGNPTPRITDENSPVKFLQPNDPFLNRPNKITQADFQNWIQERGLYYWSDFDSRYTALLAMNDPGEKDLHGGLVYTHWGKGTYIYTGLAFFRELPEGVPGAYRLFVNLISASKLP